MVAFLIDLNFIVHPLFYNYFTPFCSDPTCGVSPAEKLSPEHLQLLRKAFTCAEAAQMEENSPNGRSRNIRSGKEECEMKFEKFRDVLTSVIGPDIEDSWAERFFNEVITEIRDVYENIGLIVFNC